MIDRGRHSVLGVRVSAVDYAAAVDRIIHSAHNDQPFAVSALAVHGLMTGVLDSAHRHRLNKLDLLAPDGQPVRWALNRLYRTSLPDRVYGPQLMLEVCRRAASDRLPVFLFGGSPDLLRDLRASLESQFPELIVAGTRASRFRSLDTGERAALVDDIRASGAKILFVGLGCPRQEVFVYEMRSLLPMPMLAVGAAFNFHAGQLSQAPPRLQRCGLEWAYRLAMEPRRLWKRYLLLNPLYVALLACQSLGVFRIDPDRTTPPLHDVCYG